MTVIKFMINKLALVFTTLKPAGGILITLCAIFAPVAPIMYGVLFLIFADICTGIMASYYRDDVDFHFFKWNSWKHITSKKMGDSIAKTVLYMLLILSGAMVDFFIIPNTGLYFTKLLAGAIAVRELKSLVENGEIILGGGFITMIRAFFKNGFKGGMEEVLKDENNNKDGEL